MAAKKKKSAKKAVKKAVKAVKKAVRPVTSAPAARKHQARKKPETLRIRHISTGFTVNDIQRSLAWYTNVLGFVVKDRWMQEGTLMGAEVRAGSATLFLGQDDFKKGRDRVKGVGVRLFCQTAQDLDLLAEVIKKNGGQLDHEPMTQPWGSRDFGITDPDGYKITVGSLS